MQSYRQYSLVLVALFLFLSLAACSGKSNPWVAPDQGQFLMEKVKTHRNAYLRYSQAEDEARKDGNAEAVEHYVRAKDNARKELDRYEGELAAYQTSKGLGVQKTTP